MKCKPMPDIIMNRLEKYCKGCVLKKVIIDKRDMRICIIANYRKNKYCPCINCLVKTTCMEKDCDERVDAIVKTQERIVNENRYTHHKN